MGFLVALNNTPSHEKPTISAGPKVTDRKPAAANCKLSWYANGRTILPSCPSSENHWQEDTVMISRLKNSAGPTSVAASINTSTRAYQGGGVQGACAHSRSSTMPRRSFAPMAMQCPPRLMIWPNPERFHRAVKAINRPTGTSPWPPKSETENAAKTGSSPPANYDGFSSRQGRFEVLIAERIQVRTVIRRTISAAFRQTLATPRSSEIFAFSMNIKRVWPRRVAVQSPYCATSPFTVQLCNARAAHSGTNILLARHR